MKLFKSKYFLIPASVVLAGGLYACSKSFLDKQPIGSYLPETLANGKGVQGLLIGAYSLLDGNGGAGRGSGDWVTAADNWVYGSVAANETHKGSDPGDQPDIVPIERHSVPPSNSYITGKFQWAYDGIQRANEVLRILRKATDIKPADTPLIVAQARFLRAHYHFELRRMYEKVPYVDENVTYAAKNYNVPNDQEIYPKIEADLQYAVANLNDSAWVKTKEYGRVNQSAAKAYLAKVYLYEHKYAEAKALFDDVINKGVTTHGVRYALVPNFHDNFDASTKNNSETVFAAQMSVNDGAGAANANAGDVLNFTYNSGKPEPVVGCCGFFQPSWTLVNSFKVDATGLPFLDGSYNNTDLKNDQGISSDKPYTPDNITPVDPRLDWSVGRRGIPYLDWGVHPGSNWMRNQASAGPYSPLKNVPLKSQVGTYTDNSSWTPGYTAINYNIIRYADVLLMAAEAEIEAGSLATAENYVNMVRNRAKNSPKVAGSPANYQVQPYPVGTFTARGVDYARNAVRFERKVELAMEGHRFFDLVRWGIADQEINATIAHEVNVDNYTLLKGATFEKGKDEYFPIPQSAIDLAHGALKPNGH